MWQQITLWMWIKSGKCLDDSGFGDRLQTLSQGIDTYLYKDYEEEGIDISGGEAQKIAIARALYKDAPFVLLDEPTAALDPIAESGIYTNFDKIVGNKTGCVYRPPPLFLQIL